jgi:Kef-type K+ transport system membrane component KefB
MTRRQWWLSLIVMIVAAGVLLWIGLSHRWDTGTALGVAGIAVSVGGFAVAIIAIQATRTSAEATYAAINSTLAGVAASRLAIAITQLRQLIVDLEDAVSSGDGRHARILLNQWRYLAQDAQGLITRRFGADHDCLSTLGRSIRAASRAKGALYTPTGLAAAAGPAISAMEKASDQLGPLLEELLPTADGEPSA